MLPKDLRRFAKPYTIWKFGLLSSATLATATSAYGQTISRDGVDFNAVDEKVDVRLRADGGVTLSMSGRTVTVPAGQWFTSDGTVFVREDSVPEDFTAQSNSGGGGGGMVLLAIGGGVLALGAAFAGGQDSASPTPSVNAAPTLTINQSPGLSTSQSAGEILTFQASDDSSVRSVSLENAPQDGTGQSLFQIDLATSAISLTAAGEAYLQNTAAPGEVLTLTVAVSDGSKVTRKDVTFTITDTLGVDDAAQMWMGDVRITGIDLFANDLGSATTLVQVGDSTTPSNGGYWADGSNGGRFWVGNGGIASFYDDGDFDDLALGETTTSSVSYTVQDAYGVQTTSTFEVTISGGAAAADSAHMRVLDTASSALNLLDNDVGAGLVLSQVGDQSAPDTSGNFIVEGDQGGYFEFDSNGVGTFYDDGDFAGLASGATAFSSVDYWVTDSDGIRSKSTIKASITNDPYSSGDPTVLENRDKVGFGLTQGNVPSGYSNVVEYLEDIEASWYYNWGAVKNAVANDITYVPMQWGRWNTAPDKLQILVNNSADGNLLTFNEPDHEPQADMTVEEAINLWSAMESTNLRLGSPATAAWDRNNNTWFSDFMAQVDAQNLRVDFIALHTYTGNTNVDNLRSYLVDIYEKYQRPIWITEFALIDWSDANRFSYDQVATFMTDAFLMLDDLSFVERYAWYVPGTEPQASAANWFFFDENGEETAVFEAYQDLMGL